MSTSRRAFIVRSGLGSHRVGGTPDVGANETGRAASIFHGLHRDESESENRVCGKVAPVSNVRGAKRAELRDAADAALAHERAEQGAVEIRLARYLQQRRRFPEMEFCGADPAYAKSGGAQAVVDIVIVAGDDALIEARDLLECVLGEKSRS